MPVGDEQEISAEDMKWADEALASDPNFVQAEAEANSRLDRYGLPPDRPEALDLDQHLDILKEMAEIFRSRGTVDHLPLARAIERTMQELIWDERDRRIF